MNASQHPHTGRVLIALGIIGFIAGIVPFTTNALRILVAPDLWHGVDLAAHGVEAMGLSVEWGLLSSAMGAFLGALLIRAGAAFRRGQPSARLLAWVYVACALTVNGADLVIFAFRARAGPMRTQMLVADGVAVVVPVLLALWLHRTRP